MSIEFTTNLKPDGKVKKEENKEEVRVDQISVLGKIRQKPKLNRLFKIIIASAGLNYGTYVVNQIITEGKRANNYLLEKEDLKEFSLEKFLDKDFIKEVAWSKKHSSLIKRRCVILSTIDNMVSSKDATGIEEALESWVKGLEDVNIKINKAKKDIDEKQKEIALNQIININILVNEAKIEIINHLKSEEYLDKLAIEMHISRAAAKKHQAVRINNVSALSIDLKHSFELSYLKKAYAYYTHNTTRITLPYDINLEDQEQKSYFYTTVIHEILHLSTNAHYGLSKQAEKILKEAATTHNSDEPFYSYFTSPAEMIVRKQILDLEMQKLGIKNYGEKFTDEHYLKLLSLESVLSNNSRQLIEFVKSEHFSKVMNELAENNNLEKNYNHSGWDYSNSSNQA